MPKYSEAWSAAKKNFENTTGMKKPTEVVKVFGKEYRKSTGIESALSAIDKAVPDNLLVPVKSKQLKSIESAINQLEKVSKAYLGTLTASIEKEKKGTGGKEASEIYRDLKILKASLEKVVADANLDLAKAKAARESVEVGVTKKYNVTYITIKSLAEGIEKGAKQALLYAQNILKDPTPANFNAAFDKAARDLTQNLANIRKWTMPEEIHPDYQKSRMEALQGDAKIYDLVHALYQRVEKCKARVSPLLAQKGGSPLDADLARMANNPPRFATTATKQDVVAATKHFIAQVKESLAIAAEMKKN